MLGGTQLGGGGREFTESPEDSFRTPAPQSGLTPPTTQPAGWLTPELPALHAFASS